MAVGIHESGSEYLTFQAKSGLYKYRRLANGISSGPAVFTHLVQLIYGKLLFSEVYAFLDDTCLASKDIDSGIDLLSRAFDCIRRSGLKIKAS